MSFEFRLLLLSMDSPVSAKVGSGICHGLAEVSDCCWLRVTKPISSPWETKRSSIHSEAKGMNVDWCDARWGVQTSLKQPKKSNPKAQDLIGIPWTIFFFHGSIHHSLSCCCLDPQHQPFGFHQPFLQRSSHPWHQEGSPTGGSSGRWKRS